VRLGALMASHEGSQVLTCSALKRRYRDRLRSFVPDLLFIYIDIDVATAAQRVGARSGHLFPKSLVTTQFAALEAPAGEHGVLAVSARLELQQQLEAVLRGLANLTPRISIRSTA
jgi:gluconokinase